MTDYAMLADEKGYSVIICCPRCDGEGIERHFTHFDRDGNECGYSGTCTLCNGTGEIEDEALPVECDDDLAEREEARCPRCAGSGEIEVAGAPWYDGAETFGHIAKCPECKGGQNDAR